MAQGLRVERGLRHGASDCLTPFSTNRVRPSGRPHRADAAVQDRCLWEEVMSEEATKKLRENLRGTLIERGDAAYEDARKLYNGMIDKRPLVIARCSDAADVMAAVNFARDKDLRIAVRGGGHNGPGLASVDDGVVVGLSLFAGVPVDPVARPAKASAGCTQRDLQH